MAKRIVFKPYNTFSISISVIRRVDISHFGGSYDCDGNKLVSIEEQTMQVSRNLEKTSKEINLGLENLVMVTVILRDLA